MINAQQDIGNNFANKRVVACCGTCKHHGGWLDNMHCTRQEIEVKAYNLCDLYENEGSMVPMDELTRGNAMREKLAEYAHNAWSGWMQYMFKKGGWSWIMSNEYCDRWTRQMSTPYALLPETEKASDRAEADKILAIVSSEVNKC